MLEIQMYDDLLVIKSPKKYWCSQKTNTNMHMWDCIDCSGFGVADQRRQFITLHFQITHLFSTAELNSSHIIVQIECTSVGNQTKWESSRKIFHFLPVLHLTFKNLKNCPSRGYLISLTWNKLPNVWHLGSFLFPTNSFLPSFHNQFYTRYFHFFSCF